LDTMTTTTLPKLQEECAQCCGLGVLTDPNGTRFRNCPHCGGLGSIATEFGKEVLDLVRRNLWREGPGEG
jgi:hypothetical protein